MSSFSQFDPTLFLEATTDEAFELRIPLPVGEYTAVIGEVTVRPWTKKDDASKTGIAWDIPLIIDVPLEAQKTCQCGPIMTLKDSLIIDYKSGTPMLDTSPGKNSRLRKYREATGTNRPGEKFGPRSLQGKVVVIRIGHEIWNDAPIEKILGVAAD